MNPKLRSFIRSLVFNIVVPVVLVLIANEGAQLVDLGLDPQFAALLALVVGAAIRAYLPNAIAPRSVEK